MSDEKVVILDCPTRLDIPVKRVLKGALAAGLTEVVVSGWDENGELWVGSSKAKKSEILWLMKKSEQFLMDDA